MPKSDEVCCCGNTGRNTRGGVCVPCMKHGRTFFRDAVLASVAHIFDVAAEQERIPELYEAVGAVRRAYDPDTVYMVMIRMADGEKAGVAGPSPLLQNMLNVNPGAIPKGATAWLIRSDKAGIGAPPKQTPVARWTGKGWEQRKG